MNLISNDYLAHHGILGQKWGVRRYQNEDGSLTEAGHKRYGFNSTQPSKNSSTQERSSAVQMLANRENYANDFSDEVINAKRTAFFNDDVKPMITEARDTYVKLERLEQDTIGESSHAAQKAYKKYLAELQRKDPSVVEDEYGFSHYQWRKGNADYDKAYADYTAKAKSLESQYQKQITDVGRTVAGEYADDKVADTFRSQNDNFSSYAEWGKQEANDIIQFDWRRFN